MSDRTAHRSDTVVADDLAQKFASEKDTPYMRWVRAEGLDIISAHYVPQPAHASSSSHGRGAAATRRLPQSRRLAHLE